MNINPKPISSNQSTTIRRTEQSIKIKPLKVIVFDRIERNPIRRDDQRQTRRVKRSQRIDERRVIDRSPWR